MMFTKRGTHPEATRESARRLSGPAVALVSAVFLIAGCSQAGEGGEKVTLSYGVWEQSQVPAMESIIESFEAENPNIEVEIQLTPWEQYWTKLQTAATGGSAPDVFWMTNAYFQNYAQGGAVSSLQEFVDRDDVDMTNYVDALVDAYTYEDEVFGIPKDVDSIGLWYNKALFDAAGVQYPDESWTWDDLRTAALALTDPAEGVYGIAAQISDQQSYYSTIPQAGGFVLSPDGTTSGYDEPEAIEAVQFWVDLINKDKVSPTLQQMTDTDPNSMFTSGQVAMIYEGSWAAIQFDSVPYAKENVDVAPMPKGEKVGGVVNGLANVMFAKTEHPEEAWKFLEFLGSEEAADIQAQSGAVIPAYKGTTDAWVASLPNYNLATFVDAIEVGTAMPASQNTAEWRSYAAEQFARAWTGEESVEDVARRVAEKMDEDLEAEASD